MDNSTILIIVAVVALGVLYYYRKQNFSSVGEMCKHVLDGLMHPGEEANKGVAPVSAADLSSSLAEKMSNKASSRALAADLAEKMTKNGNGKVTEADSLALAADLAEKMTNTKKEKMHVPSGSDILGGSSLLPSQEAMKNSPSWVKKFNKAENLVIQENMISGATESFLTNELPCTKRWLNTDLRKSPVVKTIPGLTPFNMHVVHPSCVAQQQTRPSLDGEDSY